MRRIAIIADLKEGAEDAAAALLASGPPFDLAESSFERHTAYLSSGAVVFVFEGPDVQWELDFLVHDFFHPDLRESLQSWRTLVEGDPRIGREVFSWERKEAASDADAEEAAD